MRFTRGTTAFVAGLVLPAVQASASTSSQIQCLTQQGPNSVKPVPTSTQVSTTTLSAVAKVTSTPSTTVTPAPVKLTSTVYSTTVITKGVGQQKTDTFSTTTTVFSTETDPFFTVLGTTTSTISFTATTAATTTTVEPSAGYTPLASVLAASGDTYSKQRKRDEDTYCGRVRGGEVLKRAAQATEAAFIVHLGATPTVSPAQYPQSVKCTELVEVITTSTSTAVASKTATITAKPATSTATTTSVISLTSTAKRDASTTVTFTTTSTITTLSTYAYYVTTTTTTTTTVAAPTATFYAACAQDNLISQVNGQGITELAPYNSNTDSTLIVGSAYDCCVACIQAGASCYGSAYSPAELSSEGRTCYLIEESPAPTCNGANVLGSFFTGADDGDLGTLSNSNCGQWTYAGVAQAPPPKA